MRWLLALGGLSVLACGGVSRSPGPLSNSPGGGSAGAAETTGGSGAFSSGAAGGGNTSGGSGTGVGGTAGARASNKAGGAGIGVWSELPEVPGASEECRAYRNADIAAACELSFPNTCSSELTSYLREVEAHAGYYVRSGCGLTEIWIGNSPFNGVRVFDSKGMLVGYQEQTDLTFGVCFEPLYQRGLHIADCSEVRECVLAPDAAETGQLCLCPCPESPPADGIATIDPQCVLSSTGLASCKETLDQWGQLRDVKTVEGRIHTGCGATVVDFYEGELLLSCIYDAAEKLVGAQSTSAVSSGCSGVRGWQTGVKYSSCAAEALCYIGTPVPDLSLPPKCGIYPYE